jgi:predicted ATP-grasp superfamily ATP-dependent carboligase
MTFTDLKIMKILIIENGQHAIESSRYLARLGHEIIFASTYVDSKLQSRFFSKCYSKIVRLKSRETPVERIREIKRVYDEHNCNVYFPFGFWFVTDYIDAVNEDESLRMNTPYGNYESYWKLSDKYKLYKTLENSNVKLPELYMKVRTGDEINLPEDVFPVIIKGAFGVGVKKNVILAWDNKEASSFLTNWKQTGEEGGEFIVQQYIPGHICDIGGFAINGELYYGVPQRRIVMIPLRGGPAAVNIVYDDKRLFEITKEVIKKGGWTGPFDLEFKWDPKTKDYYVLEFNGKMWGSSPLSLKANPDLVDIAVKTAVGEKVEKSLNYRKGLRYRWITSQELRAVGMGNLRDVVAFFLRFFKKAYYDFDFNDPLPDLFRLRSTLIDVFFHRERLPEPLIDRKWYNKLNQN